MPTHCNILPWVASRRTRGGERILGRLARATLAAALVLAMAPAPARADDAVPGARVETAAVETMPAPEANEPKALPSIACDAATPDANAVEEVPVAIPGSGEAREAKALSIAVESEEGIPVKSVTATLRTGNLDVDDAFAETVEVGDPVGANFDHVAEGSYFVGIRFTDPADAERYELGPSYAVAVDGATTRHNKGDPIAVVDGQKISIVLTVKAKLPALDVVTPEVAAAPTQPDSVEVAAIAPASFLTRAAAEPDYSGRCWVSCVNPGTGWDDGNLFDVTMPDGQVIRGYCMDPGLSWPSDGEYDFTGYWNGTTYDIVVWTQDAVPGGLLGSPCQRVGNFQWLPQGYMDPGSVDIQKYDADTGSWQPQNGLTFEGAVFSLTNTGTGQTWNIILNQFGTGTLSGIPLGDYTLVEITAPIGYDLDPTVHSFSIGTPNSGNNRISLKAYDAIKKGEIAIQKSTVGGTSNLAGIKFNVVNLLTDQVAATMTLDADGKGATGKVLPYGHYRIVEDAASVQADLMAAGFSGYAGDVVVSDAFVSSKDTYSYDVTNYKKINLSLVKLDGDAVYGENPDLLIDPSTIDPSNILKVTGAVYTLSRQEGGTWVEVGTATTDATGTAKFANNIIDRFGAYKIEETLPADVDSPDGYMWPSQSRQATSTEFTVDAETYAKIAAGAHESNDDMGYTWQLDATGSPQLKLTAINWKYRDIEVQKKDQESGESVGNTEFTLYRYTGTGIPEELVNQEVRGEHEGSSKDPGSEVDPTRWEKIKDGMTEPNGTMIFRGLVFGYYMVVETTPNPDYAYWYESAKSSWDRYCFAVDEKHQKQIQVYENMKITLETNVYKNTIARTTAAFTSPYDKDWNNVKIEGYRYDVGFNNGDTNVRADQYTVKDACEFVSLGLRIDTLWTPIVSNDTDGTYNIKYRTNYSNGSSSASATADNPVNKLADGTDRIDATSWHDWSVAVPCNTRMQLNVADLHLADGEYITGLLLEFGSVETGFTSSTPMSYTVHAENALAYNNDTTIIPNSATSHITRNWFDGNGLKDDAADEVETRVVDTFKYEGSSNNPRSSLSKTGDPIPPYFLSIAAIAGAAAMAIGALSLCRSSRKKR